MSRYLEIHTNLREDWGMALTPEEEERKATYDRRDQAMAKAMAVVFFDGDEDATWRAVFARADKEAQSPEFNNPIRTPSSVRIHLKAKH